MMKRIRTAGLSTAGFEQPNTISSRPVKAGLFLLANDGLNTNFDNEQLLKKSVKMVAISNECFILLFEMNV
jgi:hypothetical protein